MLTVSVVSLGAIGSAVADALARGGARVVATLKGRSERTARLAERIRAELLPDLAAVVDQADIVLSIVPPETATAVAETIRNAARDTASKALLVELNAIAPETALRIESVMSAAGLETVDGSISGPPPWNPETTRGISPGHAHRKPPHCLSTASTGSSSGTASELRPRSR